MSKITKKVRRTYLEDQGYKCDTCGEFMMCDTITLSFGFGCDKDMQPDEHYCSYKCLGLAYLREVPTADLLSEGNLRGYIFHKPRLPQDEIDFSPRPTKQDELR